VWVTTRNDDGAAIAERLGANRIFRHGEQLPRRVDAVVDNIGAVTWSDSLKAVKRGGVLVINGITSGHAAQTDLQSPTAGFRFIGLPAQPEQQNCGQVVNSFYI